MPPAPLEDRLGANPSDLLSQVHGNADEVVVHKIKTTFLSVSTNITKSADLALLDLSPCHAAEQLVRAFIFRIPLFLWLQVLRI